jgi:hypothetical protein
MAAPAPRMGIAAATAAVVGFFAAAVLPRATWPLFDSDVWWHIRAGREILASGIVPRTDTWSIAGHGRHWTSQDWLSNVILAGGHSLGLWGDTALSFLFGGLTVLAFWLLWRAIAIRVPGIGWMSRVAWLSVGLAVAGPVLGIRVQVLDLVLAVTVLWLLWHYLADRRRRWLVALPPVAALWANLHAGWVLLFLLVGATIVGEAADRIVRRRAAGTPPLEWHQLRDVALAALGSAAALIVNPNGIDLYNYPFRTLSISSLSRYVMEWSPASLDTVFGWLLLALVIVVAIPTVVFGRRNLRTADVMIVVGLIVMSWEAIRFLLIAGPITSAIAAMAVSPTLSQTRVGRDISTLLLRLEQPRVGFARILNGALLAAVLVIGIGIAFLRSSPAAEASQVARRLPEAAIQWMNANNPGQRLFNFYEWGGYIGLERPNHLIFMDGRADVYGEDLLDMYASVISLQSDPQVIMDRFHIDHVLLPVNQPLGAWFDRSPFWRRAYADTVTVIWVRR